MKKLLLTATLFLIMTIAGFAQTPKDIKVITWDDSTAFSQPFELGWIESPVGILFPASTATASQSYTVQYYNPIDLGWYELEIEGSAYVITVTTNRNTMVPMIPADFLSSTSKIRLRAGTLGSPVTINSLAKFYVIYRSF